MQQYSNPDLDTNYNGTNPLGNVSGWLAVLLGLVLLVGFFLPWADGGSAFDLVKEEIYGDNWLGKLLSRLIFGSTGLAGLGSLIFGYRLATSAYREAPFRAWMATSLGCMVVLGGLFPAMLLSTALMADGLGDLQIGMWVTLGGVVLLSIAALIGLSGALSEPDYTGSTTVLSSGSGGLAALLGLVLVVAFFLPWSAESSGWDLVKEDLGSDSYVGKLLFRLVFGSTALAGIGAMIFGSGRAASTYRSAAYRAWMTTSLAGMGLLAGFVPSFLWSSALLADAGGELKIGIWLSSGCAVMLVVGAVVDLAGQQAEM